MAFGPEVRAKMSMDVTEFQRALTKTKADLATVGSDANRKLSRTFGGDDAIKGLFMGLGFGSIEKIADNIARFFTGMSEDAEKAYGKMGDLAEKNADASIDAMRKMASDEVKYQLLLKQRARLMENPADGFKPKEPGMLESTAKFLSGSGPAKILSPFYAYWKRLEMNRLKENEAGEFNAKEESKSKAIKLDAEISEMDKKRVEKYIKETEDIANAEKELQDEIVSAEREQLTITGKIHDLKVENLWLNEKNYATELESIKAGKKIIQNEKEIAALQKQAAKAAEDATAKRIAAEDQLTDMRRDYGAAIEEASGLSIGEVAGSGKGIPPSQRIAARKALELERQAKMARARGNQAEANRLIERAYAVRRGISSLSDADRDPMESRAKQIKAAEAEVAKAKDAEKRAAKMAKETEQIAANTKRTADALAPEKVT